ncbi:MAG: OmpH family outer membrane protein [Pseudomonadota bacterium]
MSKHLIKAAAIAALAVSVAQPALAQRAPAAAPTAPAGPIVAGLGIANLEAVMVNSNAYKTAQSQRPTTYKAQYDAAEARRAQIAAQIKPLVDKFNADRAAASPNQASLQQQAQTIQQIQESAQGELQKILQPAALSENYVQEQLGEKLPVAVNAAMTKRKITLLVNPENVLSANPAYNLNQDILNELNAAAPSVQLVPPAGWEPRQVREARAQQAGQQQAPAAAPATTSKQPSGR